MDKIEVAKTDKSSKVPLKVRLRWPMRIGYVLGACSLCILGLYLYQREVRGNFGTVVPGKVYRSKQPTPDQIKDWARQYGIKTVINLRGERNPEYDAEVQAAAQAGAHVEVVKLSADHHPSIDHMRELVAAIETSPQPILLHCKEGADRAGLASVMAAMAIGGKSYDDAKGELSIIHFHVDYRHDKLGGVLTDYEDYCTLKKLPHGGWEQFRTWAMADYCNTFYLIRIEAPQTMSVAVGEAVNVDVTIKNISPQTIPCGQNPGKFSLAAFRNINKDGRPENEYAQVPLPAQDIAPGQTVQVKLSIRPIKELGKRDVMFDVWDEHDHNTWFSMEGSKTTAMELTVNAPQPAAMAPSAAN